MSTEVAVNESANLLKIRFSGRVDVAELMASTGKIEALLLTLRPKFSLLTDLSELQSMDVACVPHIVRVMDLCREQEIGTVVRVIPDRDKDIGFGILSLFHYPQEVHIVTCESLAEATRALPQPA